MTRHTSQSVTHRRPNVLWITLDSVRADHTSLHGYHRETTPEMMRVASDSEGVNLTNSIAHSTRTPVSVPSMFTGLYPSRHQMIGSRSGSRLSESMKTAPDLFSAEDYRTIGISENGYAGAVKGFDERFDEFVKPSPTTLRDLLTRDHVPSLLKYALRPSEHGPGPTLDISAHGKQNAFFTTDITKRRLKRASTSDEPVFCYVHYNDPHHPYIPPCSTRDDFMHEVRASTEEAISFANRMSNEMYEWMANGLPLEDVEWEMLHAMYDACIKYTDRCVGELFDFAREELDDLVVVVTSDHGELFGEFGLLGHHIVLDDALIHVPTVVHGLPNISDQSDNIVQHMDIMQTILEVVGADTTQFQGYDLRYESRDVAISQDLRGTVDDESATNYERIKQYNPDTNLSHLPTSLLTVARTREFKFVHSKEEEQLYNLPDESNDVSTEYPEAFVELSQFVESWFAEEGTAFEDDPRDVELSSDMKKHLRDMGYL